MSRKQDSSDSSITRLECQRKATAAKLDDEVDPSGTARPQGALGACRRNWTALDHGRLLLYAVAVVAWGQ